MRTTKRFLVRALLACAFCVGLLSTPGAKAAEGDTKEFRFFEMEFKGSAHDRSVIDMDGDGLKDIVMVYSRADVRDTHWLRVCVQDKDRGFTGNCSEFKFPGTARAFDLGEADGKPGTELVVMASDGVKMTSFGNGKFAALKDLSQITTILAGTEGEAPVMLRCLWDLDGDGRKELVAPAIQGPTIYKYEGEGFVLFQKIDSPAFVTYRVGSLGDIMTTDDVNQFLRYQRYMKRTTAHYTAPDVFITDFNGDKKPDVVTLIDNTLKVFPQGADGRFAQKPVLTFKREILPPEEKGVGFAGEAMTFNDLNNDGLGDVIMMKWGTSQERTQIDRYIYFAKKGLKYSEEPDQIIRSESAAVDFGMFDLNNDQMVDLVIPFFHFAPAQAFKVMTENAIKVQFRIFLMKENGRYGQDQDKNFAKVDRRVLVNYKIDILGMIFDIRPLLEGKFSPLISFGQDFNGDGYYDLIADTGKDKFEIFYGDKQANYGRTPDLTVDFESATDFNLADLNGDGKCDLVSYYDSKERTEKKREIALKARSQPDAAPGDAAIEEALQTTPEGTRVKVLLSR